MKGGSTVTSSLATLSSSEFASQTSPPTTVCSLDLPEVQPQVRILRRYRGSSASPPSSKRRAAETARATMPNGTQRSAGASRGIVEVDLDVDRSPLGYSLPPPVDPKVILIL